MDKRIGDRRRYRGTHQNQLPIPAFSSHLTVKIRLLKIVFDSSRATKNNSRLSSTNTNICVSAANPDVTRVLSTYLRPMLAMLKDEQSPRLQLAVVRSLSAICHRNRLTQDIVLVCHWSNFTRYQNIGQVCWSCNGCELVEIIKRTPYRNKYVPQHSFG